MADKDRIGTICEYKDMANTQTRLCNFGGHTRNEVKEKVLNITENILKKTVSVCYTSMFPVVYLPNVEKFWNTPGNTGEKNIQENKINVTLYKEMQVKVWDHNDTG